MSPVHTRVQNDNPVSWTICENRYVLYDHNLQGRCTDSLKKNKIRWWICFNWCCLLDGIVFFRFPRLWLNIMINRNLGRKRLIWLTCPDPSPSLGAAKAAPGAEAMEACCFLPMARSTGFLMIPSRTRPGVSLPQRAAFSCTKQEVKKMPHRLAYKPVWCRRFLNS